MMNLPLNVDFTGKVVVITGAGGVLCGDMARAYAHKLIPQAVPEVSQHLFAKNASVAFSG